MSSSGEALEPSLTYLRPEVLKLKQRLDDFINDEVIPAETEYHDHMKDRHSMNERWSIDAIPSCLGRLQSRAKDIGLWNIFLPPRLLKFPHWDTTILGNELRPSIDGGLTYREYGILAESTGKSILGSMACNCSAPDTGNMEVLLEFGTSYQKQHYLKPLLEGKIRSTFLMTEPDVASSDPTNLETVLLIKKHKQQSSGGGGGGGDRSGDTTYTLNGTKWWSTGAMDPRCRIGICVAKIVDDDDDDSDDTDTNNNSTDNLHGKHTIVMIPLPHPNVIMIRPLTVFGYDDAPFGHSEVGLENVPLQKEHLIGGLGSGFKVSQARLGPGRIHHCMRSIGLAQRCYDLMLNRSTERKTFGKYLFQHGSVQNDIAESFNDLNQARLLTLHCAHMMDTSPNGPRGARQYISGIKVAVPALCFRVIDRALQVHGGLGVCEDTILASAWANMRTLRIADGPDEVHRRSVARIEIKKLFLEKTSSSQQQLQQKHKSRL
jgi:acyl-CoA dehydrogenase